jgi:reductive dehalogenase
MDQISAIVPACVGLFAAVGFGLFGVISLRERESRAARVSFGFTAAGLFLLVSIALFPSIRFAFFIFICASLVLILIAFIRPSRPIDLRNDIPRLRFDERDIMFARARLEPGSPNFNSYYALRPENLDGDNLSRSKPGLLSPDSREANPLLFASAQAGFDLTAVLRNSVDGPVSDQKCTRTPAEMTSFLKSLAVYYGALRAGVTELLPYHVYSYIGRGTGRYGDPIPLEHRYAIAFTVEMDFHMIAANPAAPGVMESAKQYVEAARVAIQLANAIRRLGYPARAHIDGNYRIIAPLVARDAGLGEIGRMGILMTPSWGPRVRIGVVTTNIELEPDSPVRDPSVIDFCGICRKCAENCPARSIPFGERQDIDGALRWRINAETCYRYWCTIGTDCGVCMTVCPYSHPNSISHNLVRRGIAHSYFLRRVAHRMENLFYGRRPRLRKAHTLFERWAS